MIKIKKQKVAFIHLPRTGGSYLLSFLYENAKHLQMHNSWIKLNRDWTSNELLKLVNKKGFVHNHAYSWKEDVFYEFKKKKWFTFLILRNPKDQLCSEYFFSKEYPELAQLGVHAGTKYANIDDFLNSRWGFTLNRIPKFHKDIDYINLFKPPESINYLVKRVAGITHNSQSPILKTSNKGFDYYYNKNLIKDDTKIKIESSDYYQLYLEIIRERNILI
jgi:hypothetical protein